MLTIFISGNIYADTIYTIKKGDNPSRIAKKFKVSVQDIIKINNLRPDNLKPGTKITVPSNKKEPSAKNGLAEKQDTMSGSDNVKTVNKEDSTFHIVRRGETLLSLSNKYSVSVSELKEINNLKSTKLKTGQKLQIKQTGPRDYTVRRGDNIWRIARKFNLDPDALMVINGLETDLLSPGQKIILEPEAEPEETKKYEAILSQARTERDLEKETESKELSEIGLHDRLILFAKKLLNIPYRFGGNSLLGIDCSAFVQKVYSLIGINLPRSAREQFYEGSPVDKNDLSIGDLVFFRTYASFPSHVGIYLGNNLFIHASSKSRKVTIDSLETPYYLKRFIGAKRLIEGNNETGTFGREG